MSALGSAFHCRDQRGGKPTVVFLLEIVMEGSDEIGNLMPRDGHPESMVIQDSINGNMC